MSRFSHRSVSFREAKYIFPGHMSHGISQDSKQILLLWRHILVTTVIAGTAGSIAKSVRGAELNSMQETTPVVWSG